MKKSRTEAEPRLLDLWAIREEFGDPRGCVATTYTFDGPFFEEECLSRFVGMETDAGEDPRSYLIEREQKLADIFAAVLVDRQNVATKRSLRWHQIPLLIPGAIFHAKVGLLAWANRVRVLIGSANLTRLGYRSNYEQMAVLDFGPDQEAPAELLLDVIRFLQTTLKYGRGGHSGEPGPSGRLRIFLESVEKSTKLWPKTTWRAGQTRAVFMNVMPGGSSLFTQIQNEWRGPGPSRATVTSPFFDDGERAREVATQLLNVMAVKGQREITFQSTGAQGPDKSIDLNLPAIFRTPWFRRVQHHFTYTSDRDKDGNARALHSKCLRMERDDHSLFSLGSSNFTAAGTGVIANCNVEANLTYVIPPADNAFRRACSASVPPSEPVDLDKQMVRFRTPPDRTPESDPATVPLPGWFDEALFDPSREGGRLILSFSDTSHTFSIRDEDDAAVLSSPIDQGIAVLPWTKVKPPTYLMVEWVASDERPRHSIWVVNVTDSSMLPPPDELRDLSLEALVEVLTSSRPLYEVVARVLERQANRAAYQRALELDPHRRVDTSAFLLKRVQRVSNALEGLRERLEKPVMNLEALRWRLRGPVGPMALARRLVAEKDIAGAFLIAEIALTISQVRWRNAEASIGAEAVREEVAAVQQELRSMLDSESGSSDVERYARRTFREIGV